MTFEPERNTPTHVSNKMSELELSELLSFLSANARLDVKCTALEYVLGLTGSQEGRKWIRTNKDVLKSLFDLMEDRNEIISKDAHLSLVNLSADTSVEKCLVNYMPQLLCYLCEPQWTHADKVCTILSNLSRSPHGADQLLKVLTEKAQLMFNPFAKAKK